MKKAVLLASALLIGSAAFASADCNVVIDHQNSDKMPILALTEQSGNKAIMTTLSGSCTDQNNDELTMMRSFIGSIERIDTFFSKNGYTDKYKKLAILTKASAEAEVRLEAAVSQLFLGEGEGTGDLTGSKKEFFNLVGVYTSLTFYKEVLLHPESVEEILNGELASDLGATNELPSYDEDTGLLEEDTDTGNCGCTGPGYVIQDASASALTIANAGPYVQGNPNAPIALIEYSDIGCHACVAHYQNGTVASLLSMASGTISYTYKPIDIGYDAQYQAMATMCAGNINGASAYDEMYKRILENSTEEALPTAAQIDGYARSIGVDVNALHLCIDRKDMQAQYDDNLAEGHAFGLTGTPATVMINTITHKWTMIQGAYPIDVFTDALIELMKS